jgi:hypothetical protein
MIDGKMTVGTSKKVYDLVLLLPGALVTFNVQRSTATAADVLGLSYSTDIRLPSQQDLYNASVSPGELRRSSKYLV